MGETVFRVGIGDIQSIRIKCKHPDCGYVGESPLERIGATMNNLQSCPSCRGTWWGLRSGEQPDTGSPFSQLQTSLRRIGEHSQYMTLELVIKKAAVE
jgi:hypothetical protein